VRALRKGRRTAAQALSTPAERRSNLLGAMQIRRPELVAGKRVLLIDDVYTTGSTLYACSRLLRAAGAQTISVLTLARVDRRPGATLTGMLMGMGGAK
jgi:predicted amidophosphoribosyltransferase